MNCNNIIIPGKILFEPENKTKKHEDQSLWKKVAMVEISGDICQYYSWFLERRYNLFLNKPLRGAHITFINDSIRDLSQNEILSREEVDIKWEECKRKWNGKEISVTLEVIPKTDDLHWWLNIPNEKRDFLQSIRNELGLGRPYWGMHMSLGYANERNIEHSKYIHRTIKKYEQNF